jgi:hypothetical protein
MITIKLYIGVLDVSRRDLKKMKKSEARAICFIRQPVLSKNINPHMVC